MGCSAKTVTSGVALAAKVCVGVFDHGSKTLITSECCNLCHLSLGLLLGAIELGAAFVKGPLGGMELVVGLLGGGLDLVNGCFDATSDSSMKVGMDHSQRRRKRRENGRKRNKEEEETQLKIALVCEKGK